MTITCHYITDEWSFESAVLSTLNITEAHTAVNLSSELTTLSKEWNITDKVCCMMTDNASNITNAIKIMKWNHLPCFAHTLNLILTNSLDEIPELSTVITKVKNVVSFFHRSTKATDKLHDIQTRMNIFHHKLIQHVETRWNSVYFMLERYLEQEEAIRTTLCWMDHSDLCIPSDNNQMMTDVMAILKSLESITREMSGEMYVSASKMIILSKGLQRLTPTTFTGISGRLAERLIFNMRKRFQGMEANMKLAAATLLDPRLKEIAFSDPNAAERAKDHIVAELAHLLQTTTTTPESGENTENSSTNKETSSVWQFLDERVAQASSTQSPRADAVIQIQQYLRVPNVPRSDDPLLWWKENSKSYPVLQKLVKKYLVILATSVPSERVFSKAGELSFSKEEQAQAKDR